MTRFDRLEQYDTPPTLVGDRGWIGVNMRLDPSQLQPGYASEAVNMRFRRGIAETRLGCIVPAWANKIVSGDVNNWGTVYGFGLFSDPYTLQDYLVIAADGNVYYTQPHNAPQQMTLPAGVTITSTVTFTQAFDTLIMHRGESLTTLTLDRITNPWTLVQQTPFGDGIYPIPNATHSVFFQNRLFIPTRDDIAASDIGDYTRYSPVEEQFKVNQGSSDKLVALYKFNDSTLIAFKERSIYAIENVYGNLDALRQDELTSQYGCASRRSIAHVGGDLWFLSEQGVMSIRQTDQNKLQNVLLPMSDPIQPLIDRINWRYAANAVATYWDSKYYLAVPLDAAEVLGPQLLPDTGYTLYGTIFKVTTVIGKTYRFVLGATETQLVNGAQTLTRSADFVAQATVVTITKTNGLALSSSLRTVVTGLNTHVLVYDFLNGAWSGSDEADAQSIVDYVRVPVLNRQRILSSSHDGFVRLMEEEIEDVLAAPYLDIVLTAIPSNGTGVQINGGSFLTTNTGGINGALVWGTPTGSLTAAAQNLWTDSPVEYGYYPYSVVQVWTAPNTVSVPITGGVRWYSTNGVVPELTSDPDGLGYANFTQVTGNPIVSRFVTRGYTAEDLSLLGPQWLVVDLQTWNPQFSASILYDGVSETAVVETDKTRDRTLYFSPADATAFDLTNAAGGFLTAYRQDYSILLGQVAANGEAASFNVHTTSGGTAVDLLQDTRNTWRLPRGGRAVRCSISNSRGRIRVMSAFIEGDTRQISAGVKA